LKKIFLNISVLLLLASVLVSCHPARLLQNGENLVKRNVIKLDNKTVNTDDVSSYIKQKPNRKMFGFYPFHLYVYNYAMKGNIITRFDSFLLRAIAEPPIILDTLLTNKSVKQIKLYLNSKGYFNSSVTKEIKYKKRKKAVIYYNAKISQPYYIRSLKYSIPDLTIKSIINKDSANSLIIPGKSYDTDVLQSERERITTVLKNYGYFYFSKEFITYDIDSSLGCHKLDVKLYVRDPVVKSPENSDSLVTMSHKRYTINEINIYPDYSFIELDTARYLKYKYLASQRRRKATPTPYNFFYKDFLRIKPKTITQSIFFKKGDGYHLKDVDETYNRMIDLKMFRFVNIQFSEAVDTALKSNLLNCDIQLTRTPVQSFSTEFEATNSAGNLGIAGNLVYMNKNIFRGAEIFRFKVRGATEIQKVFGQKSTGSDFQQLFPFNTREMGAEASLEIPKFLIPIKQERFPKYFKPKTTINTGISYQKRTDYTRYIINVSYGFEWKETSQKKHIVSFPELNSVKIFPSDTFASKINSMHDPKVINSYKDHMIEAIKYSFIFNGQQLNKNKSFSWFRINLEVSGFPLTYINKFLHSYHYADGSYMLFGIKYAQYKKIDVDFRHYFIFNNLNTIAAHISGGWAHANGKTALPFEKSFYVGGSNSIRAWKIYSLGPGNDTLQNVLNSTGDINMEGSIEYRFPIYGLLKGALFLDAGNIWLNNNKNDTLQLGEISSNFYKEFAIAAGIGTRFDFSFFVIRLDAAIKVRDPSQLENQRWVPFTDGLKHVSLNLGIGYPF
jgi:outer membrane protein assembly factor BamA